MANKISRRTRVSSRNDGHKVVNRRHSIIRLAFKKVKSNSMLSNGNLSKAMPTERIIAAVDKIYNQELDDIQRFVRIYSKNTFTGISNK